MDKILFFILNHCDFLYKIYKLKFTDSEVTEHFGGDSYLILSSETLNLRFVIDRGQFFLEFQSNLMKRKNRWFSIDLIRKLIRKEEENYYSFMDEENASFLRDNFDEILVLFSEENIENTYKELAKLAKIRSKRMFS